ncbi:hypothetical protein B0H10DRAFT_1405106 [Mycena sp. CBHHK59/15]|nr:hypothetical protein B0H10DRAFT_1405106 [Mycena sp. CBHHK59/15]
MSGSVHTQYSCACLNVRIVPVPQDADPPATAPPSPDFCPVHVSDEGISVAHPQVTLRIRTRGELTSRNHRARYTSLTCLLCRILVYRVHQIVSLDADARDGPLMPTEDWVEQDILKSPSGWIEVHKQCLTGDAIARVEASSQYSTLFSLAIPLPASPLASSQPSVEDGPQMSYLAHLPPLFLPPPFTPAHPVFVHLAALAKTESQAHRTALETYMAEVMRAKTAELARTEALLRSQVETVWRRFRKGLMAIEPHPDTGAQLASPRSPRSPAPGAPGTPASPTIAGTPLAVVRDFVPQPVASAARALHSAAPVVSSLSASLATSAFHHPRAQQQQQQHTPASPPARPASMISSSSRTLSGGSVTLAGSPRPVPLRAYDEGASVLQFGRTTDDTINTAASYQFFRTLEEDMARSRREQQLKKGAVVTAASADAGPSTVNGKGKGKAGAEKNGAVGSAPNDAPHAEGTVDDAGVRDKGKGKQRKVVTFESQPDVVTIKREVNAEKEEEARRARDDGEEMIFVLEADGKERDAASADTPVLMLVEPTAQPRTSRPRRQTRKGGATDSTGLPQSFSGLRPASLPVPSKIVPRRRASRGSESPQNDGAATIQEEDGAEEEGEEEEEEEEEGEDEEYDSRDVQILKLVAANTPSHRGAWKKDSAAWKSLVSRDSRTSDADDEEDDGGARPPAYTNGSSQAGMPGSMPIAIRPLVKPQTNLSLASYRPQTLPALPQELEEPEPPVPVSSSSVRKAVYAERDRSRLMDPGALDFAADDEEEEEEDDDDEDEDDRSDGAVGSASGGERAPKVRGGRKRALKILRARNELPDSGMWRSLAS